MFVIKYFLFYFVLYWLSNLIPNSCPFTIPRWTVLLTIWPFLLAILLSPPSRIPNFHYFSSLLSPDTYPRPPMALSRSYPWISQCCRGPWTPRSSLRLTTKMSHSPLSFLASIAGYWRVWWDWERAMPRLSLKAGIFCDRKEENCGCWAGVLPWWEEFGGRKGGE